MNINYRTIILNLRGAGGMSGRRIEAYTGVSETKICRMATDGNYIATDQDMIQLLDLHYDICPHLHKRGLITVEQEA